MSTPYRRRMALLSSVWANATGTVFMPWIPGDCQTDEDRKKNWHSGPAFRWPEDHKRILAHLIQHTDDDLYFTPGVYAGDRRIAGNLQAPSVLWADLDEADPRQGRMAHDLMPTIAWETSPGRYQAIWILDSPKPGAAEAGNENQRLTYALGADKSGWNAAKVLRVPGMSNHKPHNLAAYGRRGAPGQVLWQDGPMHDWATFEALPEVPGVVRAHTGGRGVPSSPRKGHDRRCLAIGGGIRSSVLNLDSGAGVDNSRAIWRLILKCAEEGLPADDTFHLFMRSPVAGRYSEAQWWSQIQKAYAKVGVRV